MLCGGGQTSKAEVPEHGMKVPQLPLTMRSDSRWQSHYATIRMNHHVQLNLSSGFYILVVRIWGEGYRLQGPVLYIQRKWGHEPMNI